MNKRTWCRGMWQLIRSPILHAEPAYAENWELRTENSPWAMSRDIRWKICISIFEIPIQAITTTCSRQREFCAWRNKHSFWTPLRQKLSEIFDSYLGAKISSWSVNFGHEFSLNFRATTLGWRCKLSRPWSREEISGPIFCLATFVWDKKVYCHYCFMLREIGKAAAALFMFLLLSIINKPVGNVDKVVAPQLLANLKQKESESERDLLLVAR